MNEFWEWLKGQYEGIDKVLMSDGSVIYARTGNGMPSTQVMAYGIPSKAVVSVGSVPIEAYKTVAMLIGGLAAFCKPLHGRAEVTLMGFAAQALILLEDTKLYDIKDADQGTVVTVSNDPSIKMPRFGSIVHITLKD